MLYPTQVDINEKNIEKLTATFKGAYKQIVSEINRATDWGVQNRKALLKQIEGILEDLSVDVDEFVKKELPTYYEQGFKQGIKQLENIDAEVVSYSFNKIHKEAIEALVSDTAKAFGESMTGVARSADLLINKATREGIVQKMAQGQIGGSALKQVRDQIKGQLAQQGLSALVDKSGRTWELDRYAEMLFRTKAVEARNTALRNLMAENDYDLVQVSSHGGCDLCQPWEGKILSATGATKGYPTVADAEAGGLFHPNAVLSGSTFVSYGELDEMVGADYEGPAIIFRTSEGYEITIGPNHPILTDRGFVRAKDISKEHKLVYDSRIIIPNGVINSNFQNAPMVEDVFKSLFFMNGNVSKVSTTSHDFHGDRVFCKGEVEIVKPARSLLAVFNPVGIEKFRDDHFMPPDMQLIDHSSKSPSGFSFEAVDLSTPSSMGGTLSGFYKFLHISEIIHNPCYKGKAYDATTKTGIYNSNGFVVSNCKHVINVLIPSLANQTKAYNPDEDTKLVEQPQAIPTPKAQERTKEVKVYHATGGEYGKGEAVLGDGFYFAFDKDNVKRYGEKVLSFKLPPDVKMLDLTSTYDLTKFTEEAIADNRGVYMAYLEDGKTGEGLAEIMKRQAVKKGYDGIIGDDTAFGSVIFNKKLLK